MRALLVLTTLAACALAQPHPGHDRLPLENVDHKTATTIELMRKRRVETFVSQVSDSYVYAHPGDIHIWVQTLDGNGKWPDSEIDYTSGCQAQRANWPAVDHWHRLFVMAAAWHNSIPASVAHDVDTWAANGHLREVIGRAMKWWFDHDFERAGCLDGGGSDVCPCQTKGLWNTNWFASIIYLPKLVSQVCAFLTDGNSINLEETMACVKPMQRAFYTFHMDTVKGLGAITGANAVDIAAIGVDTALLTANTTTLDEAYMHVHHELVLKDKTGQDGIRTDGAFAQHGGYLLYAGNYGKDYINAVVAVEAAAVGTKWTANENQRQAFSTLFEADRWMIYRNVETSVLHWDFSALNRFISFPVADNQATAGIHLNLTQVGKLGSAWNSIPITVFSNSLQGDNSSSNAGKITGTKVFWTSDYVVSRGPNYVASLKMYSKRTQNSECVNNQNPFGFHLADGALYTYAFGVEYEDIAAAWNWTLIPGTTVFPGSNKLECSETTFLGKEAFVGGATDGQSGIAAMKYRHPIDDKLGWQKAWFFLADDVQVVLLSQVTPGVQAISVMDQKRRTSDVAIDGVIVAPGEQRTEKASTLWHGHIGYSFMFQDPKPQLVVRTATGHGNWSSIGTSKQGAVSVDFFTAYVEHDTTEFVYAIFPGMDLPTFQNASANFRIEVAQNDELASAIYYPTRNQVFIVFWKSGTLEPIPLASVDSQKELTVSSDSPITLLYDINNDKLTVADPTQELSVVKIILATPENSHTFEIKLPGGGKAGSTISQSANRVIALLHPLDQTVNAAEMHIGKFESYLATLLSFVLSFVMFL